MVSSRAYDRSSGRERVSQRICANRLYKCLSDQTTPLITIQRLLPKPPNHILNIPEPGCPSYPFKPLEVTILN